MHGCNATLPGYLPGEQTLIHFVCYCADVLHLAHATIKVYLAGVKYNFVSQGQGDPFLNEQGIYFHTLKMVLRGIKMFQGSSNKLERLPITSQVLYEIFRVLDGKTFSRFNDCLMKAACSLAFFGFLRCGEFTTLTNNFDPEINPCLEDVIFSESGIGKCFKLRLKASKTDPFREGCLVSYHANLSQICPHVAMETYLKLRNKSKQEPKTPLFVLENGTVLSRAAFLEMLSAACMQAGVPPRGYTGHSFRIGAATTAAKRNVPEYLIQHLGRWSSDCFKTYIRTPQSVIAQAQMSMSNR